MTNSTDPPSTIDDVWASLNDGETERLSEYRKRAAALKKKSKISVVDLIKLTEKKEKDRERIAADIIATDSATLTLKSSKKKRAIPASCVNDRLSVSELSINNIADDTGLSNLGHISPEVDTASKSQIGSTSNEQLTVLRSSVATEAGSSSAILITANEMSSMIARDLNSSSAEDINTRRKALQKLHKILFSEYTMSTADYNVVFRDCCKSVFRRFSDPSEKCRELSLKITQSFFDYASDFVPILAYFFPMLMQRLPGGLAYDEDMKVFVTDIETHEAYRRGKAVDRQDKSGGAYGILTHSVVEESEEIRNLSCKVLGSLLRKTAAIGVSSMLHPYFHEVIMYLQMQLRDPFPDLKAEACGVLELLARTEEFNSGMKFFAVALVRATLPVLRHRHAKVRLVAVRCLAACMVVPDKAKIKGSGTDAIADLVGFREENVLQVSAFYRADVQINYLAELVSDSSVPVKESVVQMLGEFMTEMGDRYDHQTRLLPYILDLLTDEAAAVSSAALAVLRRCGQQYEEEHQDEIIERRQYGVDGDDTMNFAKALPKPFTERPRIGMRLFVRGNSKRFLSALVNELTNWLSGVRVKSARLLKVVVTLCEEHLTMEVHTLLPSLIKALRFATDDSDKDRELHTVLTEVFELLGRYISPSAYIHYILPRLRADAEVSSFGTDTCTRVSVMEALQALVEGSKASQVVPFFSELVATLTDPFVIDPDSPRLIEAALRVLLTILQSMQGRGQAAVEAQYVATGRLSTLRTTISKLFKFFVSIMSRPSEGKEKRRDQNPKAMNCSIVREAPEKPLDAVPPSSGTDWGKLSGHGMSIQGLHFIMQLEGGVGAPDGGEEGMRGLFMRYGLPLMESLLPSGPHSTAQTRTIIASESLAGVDCSAGRGEGVECPATHLCKESGTESDQMLAGDSCETFSEMEESDYRLLCCLVSSPWGLPLLSPRTLHSVLRAVLSSTREALSLSDPAMQEAMLIKYGDLLMSILTPLCYLLYPATQQQAQCYPRRLFDSSASLAWFLQSRESEGADVEDCGPSLESIKSIIDSNGSETVNSVYWTGLLAGWSAGGSGSPGRGDSKQSILLSSGVVSEHLGDILACFVESPLWLRSAAMQARRIEMLCVLTGYAGGSVSSRFQTMVPVRSGLCETIRSEGEGESASTFPLIVRSAQKKKLSGALSRPPTTAGNTLCLHASEIFSSLSVSMAPSSAVGTRLVMIEFVGHLFRLLCDELSESDSRSRTLHTNTASRHHLISYATRKMMEYADQNDRDCYELVCVSARQGISLVMSALNDGSDAVCVAALEALQTAVPLVLEGDEDQVEAASLLSAPSSSSSFECLLLKLLFQVTTCTSTYSAGFDASQDLDPLAATVTVTALDILDSVLRRLAGLDPEHFGRTVRQATDSYLAAFAAPDTCHEMEATGIEKEKSPNPVITSTLSGLLDHADMLAAFISKQQSKHT